MLGMQELDCSPLVLMNIDATFRTSECNFCNKSQHINVKFLSCLGFPGQISVTLLPIFDQTCTHPCATYLKRLQFKLTKDLKLGWHFQGYGEERVKGSHFRLSLYSRHWILSQLSCQLERWSLNGQVCLLSLSEIACELYFSFSQ